MDAQVIIRSILVLYLIKTSTSESVKDTECHPESQSQSLSTEEENCVSDFIQLQKQALHCNSLNRFKVMQTFAPVNKDTPLALLITYRQNTTNSSSAVSRSVTANTSVSEHIIKTYCADAEAPDGEMVWLWTRVPLFLMIRPHILNWFSLTTMMHFRVWKWKHLQLDIPDVCSEHEKDFLAILTQQIHFYAGGYRQEPSGQNAFVMEGKSPNAFCGAVHPISMAHINLAGIIDRVGAAGTYLATFAVFALITAWMSKHFPNLAKRSHEYTYQTYGVMWGVIITMAIAAPALFAYCIYIAIYCWHMLQYEAIFHDAPYHVTAVSVITIIIVIPNTIYFSVKYKLALPKTVSRLIKLACRPKVGRCVHGMVQGCALLLCFYTVHALSIVALWMVIALVANPYTVMVSAAIVVVVLFSLVNLFAVMVTLPHSQHSGKGGLFNRIKITLLQVASIVFFIITTGCVVGIIAATNNITRSESDTFANIRLVVTPVVVTVAILLQKAANSYFVLQGVKLKHRQSQYRKTFQKQKGLELSDIVSIDNHHQVARTLKRLTEPLLEYSEEVNMTEIEWELREPQEGGTEPQQELVHHSDLSSHTAAVSMNSTYSHQEYSKESEELYCTDVEDSALK